MVMISEWWTRRSMRAVVQAAFGKTGGPVAKGQVRGEDDAALLVPAAHDLEEEVGISVVVGEVPDLVAHQ
jgi:hypothetical protein